MKYIPKTEIARLLYCLNWHTMDLIGAFHDQTNGLSDQERLDLQDEINTYRELKTQVLRKLVREGHAFIRSVDVTRNSSGITRYYRTPTGLPSMPQKMASKKARTEMKRHMLVNRPRERDQTLFEAYSFDEAYYGLCAYINGEISVSPFARHTLEGQKPAGFSVDEAFLYAMIKSVALIGHRVISQYCKGDKPNAKRLHACETGLTLAKRMSGAGLIMEYGQGGGDLIIGGYSFKCRLYFAECAGVFLLPEQSGKKVKGYFGSFPSWALQCDTWPIDEKLAEEIISYSGALL